MKYLRHPLLFLLGLITIVIICASLFGVIYLIKHVGIERLLAEIGIYTIYIVVLGSVFSLLYYSYFIGKELYYSFYEWFVAPFVKCPKCKSKRLHFNGFIDTKLFYAKHSRGFFCYDCKEEFGAFKWSLSIM